MTEDAVNLTRRQFGQAAGALVLAFTLTPRPAAAQAPKLPGNLNNNRMLDAWLRINADGSAIIFTGKVELGQGILTALAQIAAEELDLPLGRVKTVSGDTAQTPDEGHTSGSQSIEYGGTAVRLACAEARALLVGQAAKRLGVPADALKVSEGVITAADARKLGYGELAAELDLDREATATGAAKTAGAAHDRWPVVAAARYTGQGYGRCGLCAGHPAPPHGARPGGASTALWRPARQSRRGGDPRNAGGRGRGARWQLSRCRRRT